MTKQSDDIAQIRELAKDWTDSWNRGDREALLALYADEPILMPQGQAAVVGKAAIRTQYQSLFEAYEIRGEGNVVEVEVSGDLGYFWSTYTLTAAPKAGGEPVKGEGRSIFIVKRQPDRTWKIARLIDNSEREE